MTGTWRRRGSMGAVLMTATLGAACAPPAPAVGTPSVMPAEGAPVTDGGSAIADPEHAARSLVDALARRNDAAAEAQFDEAMRAALPADRLDEAWGRVVAQVGAFEAVERVRVLAKEELRIALVRCRFERGAKMVKVVLDGQSQVAGLFFLDAGSEAAWVAPAYANADSFEEQPIALAVPAPDRPGGTMPLDGVLTMPKGEGPFPAVVLVHGSGPSDADETVGAIKPFKDLAFGLASRGIAVLRYVKRSRVDPRGVITVKEEVLDAARAAVDVLVSTARVDAGRIVVVGHSQGGYMAPRVAKEDPRVHALVILAGNTRPLEDLVVEQVSYLAGLRSGGASRAEIAAANRFKADVEDPALKADTPIPTIGGNTIMGAYFLDLRGYHPEKVAADLKLPILVLRGSRDYQVGQADFDGWKRALGASSRVTWREYAADDHLFVAGSGPSTPAEYDQPGHVDSKVVDDVAAWINRLSGGDARPLGDAGPGAGH